MNYSNLQNNGQTKANVDIFSHIRWHKLLCCHWFFLLAE